MSRSHSKKLRYPLFCIVILLAAFLLIGCSGDDGDKGATGPAGPPGPTGPPGPAAGSEVDVSVMTVEQQAELGTVSMQTSSISITIASPPKVTFSLVDSMGRTVIGMDSIIETVDDRAMRFTLAKLVVGSKGEPDSWSNYVKDDDGLPTYDSPRGGGTLVANSNNTYTYTFATDVGNDPAYDPTATHRLAGQIGSGSLGFGASNFVLDFVPNGNSVTRNHKVAMTASCNECHDPLTIHGRRYEVDYCLTCHNPALVEGGDNYNLGIMVHKIHAADPDFREGDFAEVTYPQSLLNCRKCHNGADAATPQGNNWKTVQTAKLCFASCHTVPDSLLERAPFHASITGECAACHNSEIVAVLDIDKIHTTPNATENNPNLLTGQRKIDYKVFSAGMNGSNLQVSFQILSNGTSMNPISLPADLTGSPSFIVSYALAQDGVSAPADFNNLGRTAGQPESISITNLVDGSKGSLAFTNGTLTATIPNPFPAGAIRRTVGLQGYYTQNIAGVNVALHTKSAVMTLTNNTPRRSIAGSVNCSSCHEIFEGHGGNRVFTADGGVEICTMCHNPNLSSSGRSIDPAKAVGSDAAIKLGTTDTLTWPEATNTFKDMIHGIHASAFRSTDYEFVRGRNNGIYYNWSEVTFPGNPANCSKCHIGGTYLPGAVPGNALMSINRTTGEYNGQDASFSDVLAARASVPNPTDWVFTPVAGACYACHDGEINKAHMEQFGAAIDENRDKVDSVDTCAICHGPGNIADVQKAHGLLD